MKIETWKIVTLAVLPLLTRFLLYLLAFKIRRVQCSWMGIVVIAGSPFLVGFIPFRLPDILSSALAIGIAMYLMTRYTEAEVYPDILLIVFSVELFSLLVALPLLASLVQ